MAQINLLGSDKKRFRFAETGSSLAVRLMAVVLIIALGYYAYLFLAGRSAAKELNDVQAKTSAAQSEAMSNRDRQELVARQGQLASLTPIIRGHTYWSGLLPELARVTLKQASYVSIEAASAGTLILTASVPNYVEMDKFLQVFDQSQYNQQFSNVKILSINQSQEADNLNLNLRVQVNFNPDYIRNPNP